MRFTFISAAAIAPGGYGWAFPRGKDTSNIGIVLGNAWRSKINIREKLDALLATHFPQCPHNTPVCRTYPCEGKPDVLAAPRLFKAGDSASTVNPFTRAGIVEAHRKRGIGRNVCASHAFRINGKTGLCVLRGIWEKMVRRNGEEARKTGKGKRRSCAYSRCRL